MATRLNSYQIQKEIEMATKDKQLENILSLSAEQIMSLMTAIEFGNLIYGLPKDNIHFLALLVRLKYQFLDIEEFYYLIPIQKYIDNE